MESPNSDREGGIDLGKLFRVLSRRPRLTYGIPAAFAVAAVLFSLTLRDYFKAETRILPPQDRGGGLAAQLLGQGGSGLIALATGMSGAKSPGELYVEIMKTRTVLDRIVDRFDLMKLYKARYRQDARRRLLGSITAREDLKSGIIFLTVQDEDPKRAADMANAFGEELKATAGGLAISEAGQRRMFFEEQIARAKETLTRSEEEIKSFQQRTGMFQIDAQARTIIEGIARIRAAIAAKEVEARVLRSFSTPQNPDLNRVEEEIRALRSELQKTETTKGAGFDPLMSSGRVPEAGMEYLRRLRQFKYNETLFELLSKQYELAKLDEAKGAVVIQVIDRAVPPERKAGPHRALIVLLAAGTGFFLAVLIVLFLERPATKPT
jgi:uncharacterized protein involved in exopolysaccharide biosynthesis